MIAVSYGTVEWMRTLARAGWSAQAMSVHRPGRRRMLRLADDLEERWDETPGRVDVGVLMSCGESQVFVPCGSEDAARALLDRVTADLVT